MIRYYFLILLVLVVSSNSMAQNYDKVYTEKKNVDVDNTIYKVGRTFYYSYMIKSKEGNNLFIDAKDAENLTSVKDEALPNQFKMEVIDLIKGKRTNKRQTEIRYSFEPMTDFRSSTGLVENGHNVWLHPMRSHFFKALETAPFPYVHLGKSVGNTWSDQMRIGDYWSNPVWGEWKGKLLLDYTYRIEKQEMVSTALGDLSCLKVVSTAKSTLGETELVSYFSEQYGFVKMEYKLLTGLKIVIDLVKVDGF
ncbi:hypothetical protein [Myroides odoratimimus]|uniref:hypothetical protein n=1 Tax=Myroides odoratimimus TaxID=76832 RepID=UPI003101052A